MDVLKLFRLHEKHVTSKISDIFLDHWEAIGGRRNNTLSSCYAAGQQA